MSSEISFNKLRSHQGAAPEAAARGRPATVAPQEAVRHRRPVRTAFPIGILLYLASIGIVATATAGVLFGVGFSLLMRPADMVGAGAAAHSRGASASSLFYGVVPNFFSDTVATGAKIV